MPNVTQLRDYRAQQNARIFFDRKELDAILNVYGRMVANGEWRDYAMGDDKDQAVFAIFRRASEMPIYRIIKCPKLARKQGAYAIMGASGQILRRGHELKTALVFRQREILGHRLAHCQKKRPANDRALS